MSQADTIEEFLRSYTGSWIGLKQDGRVYPACLASARQITPGHLGLQYNTSPEGKALQKDIDWSGDRDKLLRDYPDLGMVKVGATVGYLNTRPYRQWHKGYFPQNVRLWVPNLDDIQSIYPNVRFTPSSPLIVWQVYNREFWHPTEALKLMEEGEGIGYPLSKDFGVFINKNFENPFICYKRTVVGTHDKGTWSLLDNYKAYREQFYRETKVEAR